MKKNIILTETQIKYVLKELINEQGGDQGVSNIQQKLKDKGFGQYLGTSGKNKDGVDGILGLKTKIAIKKFQANNNLKVDGIVGIKTLKALGINGSTTPEGVASDASMTKTKPITQTQTDKIDKESFSTTTYLRFDGNYLYWIENSKVIKKWKADSGRTKWNGGTPEQLQKTKDDFSTVKDHGPIPGGYYFINDLQKRTKGSSKNLIAGKTQEQLYNLWLRPEAKYHDFNTGTLGDLLTWGDLRLPIKPLMGTNTFGRGSFYLHGGALPGSIGCIDLTTQIDNFVSHYNDWKSNTGTKKIKILVRYS